MKQINLSEVDMQGESRDIFVRAHTTVPAKKRIQREEPAKWPARVLIFDTECTLDASQDLTIGAYQICNLSADGYRCAEEGLFYADDLTPQQRKVLESYVDDPKNIPRTQVKTFPPRMRLNLYSRSEFVEKVFWRAVRKGAMPVGFNLPFDLSRLAVKSTTAEKGGWSLVLSLRKNRESGEIEPNPERPRVVITSNSRQSAFIGLSSILHPEEWPRQSRFLDLRTLGWALRNEFLSLEDWCEAFGVQGKMDHKPTGKVTIAEISYCRQDVQATAALLNAMKKEFDQHPVELRPDRAYSPASLAKAYLTAMGIAPPKVKYNIPDKELGIAMQGYYGGRAECRIRKTPVPIVLTDFTSQYPTVNALLGNWDVLTAESVRLKDCTSEVRKMLRDIEHEDTFNPGFWKRLSFFALVLPENDILPVRTVFNGRTTNIGLNYLTSKQPIWFAGPDVVNSSLIARKAPKILRAIRLVPQGRQSGLQSTNLAGMVGINPESDDFFRHVVEQRSVHKPTNKPLAHSLKVVGNSGSYGLFVEVNPERPKKPVMVGVFSDPISHERPYSIVEKTGDWYFPPVASLITAGGRLLLGMLERCVKDAGGSYLFCDTDSLCIVSTRYGGPVACPGGDYKVKDGREAVKALSWLEVKNITARFNKLNPYDRSLVRDVLKVEDVNYVDSDPSKPPRQVFGYAISAKRYALYTKSRDDISIVKASGHGLGFLYPPKDGFNHNAGAPEWVVEAWGWLLRKELGLNCTEPPWLDLPAMMRMTLTSPNVMRNRRPEWLSPFNFFLLPLLSDLGGYPAGCDRSNFKFITPFNSNRRSWKKLAGVNLHDGLEYGLRMFPDETQNMVVPESFRTILRLYCCRPESKSLAPDETPCIADTQGLLKRASIIARQIIPVGKETDRRWEQGEDMSMLDFRVPVYQPDDRMVIADQQITDVITKCGMRRTMRITGLSQHTIEVILRGQQVRRATLQRVLGALSELSTSF